MKGVVYLGDSKVEVRDFPRPEPGLGQVVTEMKVAGLCGSDLHKYHSSQKWARGRKGMISGHEPTGVVVEVGLNVEHISVGDRIAVYHRVGCGRCADCMSGNDAFCYMSGAFGRTQDGAHADYMLADARHCLPLPDDISFAVGTQLACTAGTAFSALGKIPAHSGDTLVVFGLGPVGLAALLMGIGMGYRGIGVEIHPYRIKLAQRTGQGNVINAQEDDPVTAIKELSSGKGCAGVIECSGSPVARKQAAAVASRGGTVVYVGGGHPHITVNFGDVLGKDLTLRANSVYSVRHYFEAVAFLGQHPVPLDDIVTHRYKIEQASEAFSTFDRGKTGKVIFEWEN